MTINNNTRLIGLIGSPVEHSLSPSIHNALYDIFDMNFVYMTFDVKANELQKAVEGMCALSFAGFNVTIPYKQEILKFLDDIDEEAKMIGAVNTVTLHNGNLKGYNTDGMGFIEGLKRMGFNPLNKDVAIIGAGGASRAICVYLLKEGVRCIYLINRTHQKSLELAKEFNSQYNSEIIIPIEKQELKCANLDLIVNTTPVGMWPQIYGNPLEDFKFCAHTVVVDIIYNPKETRLLQEARRQGCTVQNGIDMLIGQALESIKLWTGIDISYNHCKKILEGNIL